MSFFSQLFGFLKRNVILKYRNKFQTLPEIYNPITILIVLVLFNYLFRPQKFDAVNSYAPENLTLSALNNYHLFVYPNNVNTTTIGSILLTSTPQLNIVYFDSLALMKERYLNMSVNKSAVWRQDVYLGVEFYSASRESPSYKLYTDWEQSVFTNTKVVTTGNGKVCRNASQFSYRICAGNLFVYNGLSYLQASLNAAIKKVFIQFFYKLISSFFLFSGANFSLLFKVIKSTYH